MMNLERMIKAILTKKSMTIKDLSVASKISEPTLHAIFNRDDAKLSQLQKIAESVDIPVYMFLEKSEAGFRSMLSDVDEPKLNDAEKRKKDKEHDANQQGITYQLLECRQVRKSLERELEVTRELVKSKDEMIALLRKNRNDI